MQQPLASSFSYCCDNGWVNGARFIASPNHDQRPDHTDIDVLVIHAISLPPQCYGNQYVEDFFAGRLDANADPYFMDLAGQKASAHFYIKRSGEMIQFVATHCRAWHAGKSIFKGRQQVNNFSIGVELEGCDEHEFEDPQYAVLGALTLCLQTAYPLIATENIVGHSDIAPHRKTDPGPCFDWNRYFKSI
ncbi:1,6-anhydro-N-acetylmuramyl-L-alanine amidase AmpD [Candidatus Spongiihabitans sp.]|uniref:1,6-anhydro-N-acetylmuramyl-L-alanine amidase AmpD n=1 Tax=Candidatus Spongiihabitans sp. TaxID=3101308 RepID=UPI003C7C50A8